MLTVPITQGQHASGPARLHRRPVVGNRDDRGRGDRAVHHGVQRPGDAGAAAHPLAQARRARRPDPAPAASSGGPASSPSCCSATPITGSPANPARSPRSAWSPSPSSPSSCRRSSAACSGATPRGWAPSPAWRWASSPGPTPCWCRCLARSGVISEAILDGPWHIALLQPEALFGLTGWDPLTHALFWSMTANIGGYILVSLFSRPGPDRAHPGDRLRRRLPAAAGRGGDLAPLGGAGRALRPAAALHRPRARGARLQRLCREARRQHRRPAGGRCRADRLRRAAARRQHRRRVGARHGGGHRQGRDARASRR